MRIVQRLRQVNIGSQVLERMQRVFDEELKKGNVLLSRPEKARLFRQAAKVILADVLAELDRDS